MSSHDLHEFMIQISDEMASEYRRIFSKAAQDPGTAGDEGEATWAQLLKEWLPQNYHIETKGRLISSDGKLSPQIDVLVLKPSYPKKLLEKKVWLADGVAAAFECKNTLTAQHISDAATKSCVFRDLLQPRTGSPYRELRSPLIYGVLAHSHSWKGPNSKPITNVQKTLENSVPLIQHPRNLIDVVCVSDLGTWTSTAITRYETAFNPDESDHLRQIFGSDCGTMTAYSCAAIESESQSSTFRPIGALIGNLTRRLAWTDVQIRDFARYCTSANLGGSSEGRMHAWPLSIYSDEVRNGIVAGRVTTGVPWDEWTLALA